MPAQITRAAITDSTVTASPVLARGDRPMRPTTTPNMASSGDQQADLAAAMRKVGPGEAGHVGDAPASR